MAEIEMIPIWRDKVFDLGTDEAVDYSVSVNGVEVYKGRSVRRPDATRNTVIINGIVEGMFRQMFGFGRTDDIVLKLPVKVTTPASSAEVVFVYDWSYRYDEIGSLRHAPINGKMGKHLPYTITNMDGHQTSFFQWKEDGTIDSNVIQETGKAFNYIAFVRDDTKQFEVIDDVTGEDIIYDVVPACGKVSLCYVNEYGGWDTLLMEGNFTMVDDYNRRTYRTGESNELGNPSKVSYLNEIGRRYELHTGWLTGEQASRMHHLLGSNMVYLVEEEHQQTYPVIITSSECRYKTYHNNGNRLVDYAINVEVAMDYRRR